MPIYFQSVLETANLHLFVQVLLSGFSDFPKLVAEVPCWSMLWLIVVFTMTPWWLWWWLMVKSWCFWPPLTITITPLSHHLAYGYRIVHWMPWGWSWDPPRVDPGPANQTTAGLTLLEPAIITSPHWWASLVPIIAGWFQYVSIGILKIGP